MNKRKALAPALSSHQDNRTKIGGGHWHNGELRLPHELNPFEARIAFDLAQRHWPAQRFDWRKVDGAPITLGCRRIGVGWTRNLGHADYRFFLTAVIEKNLIAFAHFAEIISRGVVADARPARLALRDKIRPRIRGGLLFHQPEIFHAP